MWVLPSVGKAVEEGQNLTQGCVYRVPSGRGRESRGVRLLRLEVQGGFTGGGELRFGLAEGGDRKGNSIRGHHVSKDPELRIHRTILEDVKVASVF